MSEDVFVTTADLTQSRPPPGDGNPLHKVEAMIEARRGAPWHRNIFVVRDIAQMLFMAAMITIAFVIYQQLSANLDINFDFLEDNYPQAISDGPDFKGELGLLGDIPYLGEKLESWDKFLAGSNGRAMYVGLVNTLRVIILGIMAATVLGILGGIGLLSNNWLTRMTSTVYVEIFRNTPLLVLLFFIYKGFLEPLPRPRDSHEPLIGDLPFYLNAKGFFMPSWNGTETAPYFAIPLLIGIFLGIWLWRRRLRLMDETGQPANTLRYFMGSVLSFGAIGLVLAFIAGGTPYTREDPVFQRFDFEGGLNFTSEYVALFLGLVLYTAAFISDIVRAGIQAVPHGQIEAARASGLTNGQTLRLVVLPQAMRLIIPPMTNQYLNLSKNSSLAIAIGFTDVYAVASTINNKAGQAVALFALLMLTYLTLSLLLSLMMNFLNRALQLESR